MRALMGAAAGVYSAVVAIVTLGRRIALHALALSVADGSTVLAARVVDGSVGGRAAASRRWIARRVDRALGCVAAIDASAEVALAGCALAGVSVLLAHSSVGLIWIAALAVRGIALIRHAGPKILAWVRITSVCIDADTVRADASGTHEIAWARHIDCLTRAVTADLRGAFVAVVGTLWARDAFDAVPLTITIAPALATLPAGLFVVLDARVGLTGRNGAIVSVLRALSYDVAVDTVAFAVAQAAAGLIACRVDGLIGGAFAEAARRAADPIDGALVAVVTVDAGAELYAAAVAAFASARTGKSAHATIRIRRRVRLSASGDH